MYSPRDAGWSFCLILVIGLAGCGGGGIERAAIKGTVTFDGQPIDQGVISFIPSGSNSGPSTGAEIRNGKYEILAENGPVPGTNRVEITGLRSTGTSEVKGVGQGSSGPSASGTVTNIEMYIPEQFNTKSTLEFLVESGNNVEDFALKSK